MVKAHVKEMVELQVNEIANRILERENDGLALQTVETYREFIGTDKE